MKLYRIYLLCILSIPLLQAEKPVEVHIQVNQNVANEHSLQNQSNQSVDQIQATIPKLVESFCDVYKNTKTNITDYIKQNKIKCFCVAFTAMYSYISYQLYTYQQTTNSPVSWSNWYNNYTIEELLAIPGEQIGNDLLREIQSRYTDPENPTNFIYSLVQFNKILEEEIKALEGQKKIYTFLQKIHCPQIFFIETNTITEIQARIHKALFLKHIFSTWYATYKIEKNN